MTEQKSVYSHRNRRLDCRRKLVLISFLELSQYQLLDARSKIMYFVFQSKNANLFLREKWNNSKLNSRWSMSLKTEKIHIFQVFGTSVTSKFPWKEQNKLFLERFVRCNCKAFFWGPGGKNQLSQFWGTQVWQDKHRNSKFSLPPRTISVAAKGIERFFKLNLNSTV